MAKRPKHKPANVNKRKILRDPTLTQVLMLMRNGELSIAGIAKQSGISPTTLHNWDKGRTMRPQNVTMEFALRAMGYKRVITKI